MIVIAVVPSKTQWFVTNGNFVCDPVYCDDGFRSFFMEVTSDILGCN